MTEHSNLKRLIRERQTRTGESYTTARRHLTSDRLPVAEPDSDAALGGLIALLGHPEPRFQSVQVTYRVWRHDSRLREARHADIAVVRAAGRPVISYAPTTGDPPPSESVATVRDWRQGDGFRHEIHGGPQDGVVAVAANGLWWRWHPDVGGRSNEDDPSVPGTVGGLQYMLDPGELLGLAEFEVTGRSQVAGRATFSARATRLPLTDISDPGPSRPLMALYSLGSGADHYELEIDSQCGVLLAVTAIHRGEVIQTITVQTIEFDEVIPPDVFTFVLPEGGQMRPFIRPPS